MAGWVAAGDAHPPSLVPMGRAMGFPGVLSSGEVESVVVDRLKFLLNRTAERLWIRPLAMCVIAIVGAFLASAADEWIDADIVPAITSESIETLLTIMASSMLVIATFAVASMVSAYASAAATATPRTFSLVVADDVSQNALSTFVGAFIFSLVALIAVLNGFYGQAGRFALFTQTAIILAIVVVTFVKWVDRIARLGRLGSTIEKVETAAAKALRRRRDAPTLGGVSLTGPADAGQPVYPSSVGYVQRVDIAALHACAGTTGARVSVVSLPGAFAAPDTVLARVHGGSGDTSGLERAIAKAFLIGTLACSMMTPGLGWSCCRRLQAAHSLRRSMIPELRLASLGRSSACSPSGASPWKLDPQRTRASKCLSFLL